MKITEQNKIHFLSKDESSESFTSIELEAYIEVPQSNNKIRLKQLRDKVFDTYLKHKCADFSKLELGSEFKGPL